MVSCSFFVCRPSIPGGRSPEYLAVDASVLELVTKFADSRKPIAAIGRGLLVLAAADLVKGRMCSGFPHVKPVLVAAGAQWVEPSYFYGEVYC